MINVEEDDDGNKASGRETKKPEPKPKPKIHRGHVKWLDAVEFYKKEGNVAITSIKQSFTLSDVDMVHLMEDANGK